MTPPVRAVERRLLAPAHSGHATETSLESLCCSYPHDEVFTMGNVSGRTGNGFTYEGDYQAPSAGRVHWTATFRRQGDYAGMRHGCVHGLAHATTASLDEAIKADIESTWTDIH
jgi:hypothetical protein